MKPVSESIKFTIDTNIVSAFFKGEPDIGARVREAQQVYLPISVLAEVYFGAEKSPDPERKRQQIDRFLPLVEVLQTTAQTARLVEQIREVHEQRKVCAAKQYRLPATCATWANFRKTAWGVADKTSFRLGPIRINSKSAHELQRNHRRAAEVDGERETPTPQSA
jgi:hypothetical protein